MKNFDMDDLLIDLIKESFDGSEAENTIIGLKAHNEYFEMTRELNDEDFMEEFYAHIISCLEERALDVPKMLRKCINRYTTYEHSKFISNF